MYNITQKLLPRNPYTRPGTRLNAVRGIVIHWTANRNAGADDEAHFRYLSGSAITARTYASAHYFVDHDSILQVIPNNEMAYHVGATRYMTNRLGTYPNNCTIGVETCVNRMGGDFKKANERSAWLVAKLLKDHGLTVNDLYRHHDVTGKDCPKYFVTDSTAREFGFTNANAAFNEFKTMVSNFMRGTVKPPVAAPAPTPANEIFRVFNAKDEQIAAFSDSSNAHLYAEEHQAVLRHFRDGKVVATKSYLTTVKQTGIIGRARIEADALNLRDKPGVDGKVLKVLTKGSNYNVYEVRGTWYRLSGTGWASAGSAGNLLTYTKGAPKATSTFVEVTHKGLLAVRRTADFSAPVADTVREGEVFTVVRKVAAKGGGEMYELASGLFITASTKYVKTFTR